MRTVLLGPQRRPTLGTVAHSLELTGPVATITAGWAEREPEYAELHGFLGDAATNLGLFGRWQDVLERDPEYGEAERTHRAELDELQELHMLALDGAIGAARGIARDSVEGPVRDAALADAAATVMQVDERHVGRVAELTEAFERRWHPGERLAVAAHREDVAATLGDATALVVAGGHVGILLHVLTLFAVPRPQVLIAWSAGAMALTERVMLFHDKVAGGPSHAEFAGLGLGWLRGCVLLPHARRRLCTDDLARMAELAVRAAPATCVVLDDGVRLDLGADGELPPGAKIVQVDGRIGVL